VDILTVKSLQLKGRHGVHPKERLADSTFEVDLILKGNFRPAGQTDDLSLTFDYEQAEEIAARVLSGSSKFLIETLCYEIGEEMMKHFTRLERLEVAIRKLSPPLIHPVAHTEIRMQWQRS